MMKKMIKTALFSLVLGLSTSVYAQKFGYIDTNELLASMPEKSNAETQIQNYAKELEAQLKTMSGEFDTKVADYQSKAATMTEAIKKTKEKEIMDLQERIKEFQASAQGEIERKEKELLQPMIEKAKKAIEEVAKENKFTYIFDSGVGVLLYKPEGDDIMPLVRKKLNITAPAAAPAAPKK
jgi:outer membrane protein